MEWKVAPTYRYAKIEKVDENAHKAYVVETCPRCGGSGAYIVPSVFSGVCFKCNGAGKLGRWVKAYTDKEYDQYMKAQARAKEKRVQKEAERVQNLKDNSEANKRELLVKWGFDPDDPAVYLVVGGDTFKIKDELKERGGRFNYTLNWHFTNFTEVPAGYSLSKVPFDDVYEWMPMVKRIELREEAKKVVEKVRLENLPESDSEWMGQEKERLRELKVTLTDARAITSQYGTSILFTFDCGKNKLAWITSCPPDEDKAVVGREYLLTGTVKKHEERNGVKQTLLNRCILKEV